MAEISAPSLPDILIHAGYFGICLVKNKMTLCTNSANINSHDLVTQLNALEAEPLLEVTLILQKKIILYFIIVGGVFFTIVAFAAAAQHYSVRTIA